MRFLISIVGLTSFMIAGCSAVPEDRTETQAEELRTITALERVGDLAFGESKSVPYSDRPLYRALRVTAAKGDLLDVTVAGNGLDPKVWILRAADSRTLALNNDADASTHDAHVELVAPFAGDYLVVFREMNREDGSLTVSLAARAGQPGPNTTSLYGFVAGQRVVAKGVGDKVSEISASYQTCRRKVTSRIPCGGWATVTLEAGKTNVAFGIMGHSDYYEHVSGNAYFTGMQQVPPPYNNPFWRQVGSVALDASGSASLQHVSQHHDGSVSRTNKYEVDAVDGAITISLNSVGSANCTTNETCTIRVLAP